MGDTAKLNLTSIKFCERRIRQLKSQKEELEQTMAKNLVTQAIPKRGKKHRKVVHDLEMRKELVEQADLEVAKKHAMKIDSLEETIKFMKKRLRCLTMAVYLPGGCAGAGGAGGEAEAQGAAGRREVY
jgi:hypothetical protein